MSYFRLRFFDKTFAIVQSFDLIAPDCTNAIRRARGELILTRAYYGFEVWQSTVSERRTRKWMFCERYVRLSGEPSAASVGLASSSYRVQPS